MQEEIEAKFLDVNHDEIREKLKEAGAILEKPMRTMRRTVFDYPDQRIEKSHSRLRVRDEGDKVTVTFKSAGDKQYQHETETTVGSYETMVDLFESIGLKAYSTQESKRETWLLDDCEVVLDVWPWLKMYIEVEGPSEMSIRACASKLGFDWAAAKYGSIETAYRVEYPGIKDGETVSKIGEIRFEAELPTWLEERRAK
ncbi:MAG: uncharacterized protein JWL89_652 [Candidatus Saccharibacteria bacterium]|jgi:adenylate cyclase class 2|nr:uncharacterized protein [Candidatus Saccharibacteria bacterium]